MHDTKILTSSWNSPSVAGEDAAAATFEVLWVSSPVRVDGGVSTPLRKRNRARSPQSPPRT
jgi:hypothetical protein